MKSHLNLVCEFAITSCHPEGASSEVPQAESKEYSRFPMVKPIVLVREIGQRSLFDRDERALVALHRADLQQMVLRLRMEETAWGAVVLLTQFSFPRLGFGSGQTFH